MKTCSWNCNYCYPSKNKLVYSCRNCKVVSQIESQLSLLNPTITKLYCQSCIHLHSLPSLPNLIDLDCSECTILPFLPEYPNIKTLNVHGCILLSRLHAPSSISWIYCFNCPLLHLDLPLFLQCKGDDVLGIELKEKQPRPRNGVSTWLLHAFTCGKSCYGDELPSRVALETSRNAVLYAPGGVYYTKLCDKYQTIMIGSTLFNMSGPPIALHCGPPSLVAIPKPPVPLRPKTNSHVNITDEINMRRGHTANAGAVEAVAVEKEDKEKIHVDSFRCPRCLAMISNADKDSHANSHSSLILPFLFLGGERNAKNLVELTTRTQISHIINMAWECANAFPEQFVYSNFRLSDYSYENIFEIFEAAADTIELVRRKHGRVLVHCVQGISRSASIVCAYLIKYQHLSLKESLELIQRSRPIAFPNVGFQKQLAIYEKTLRALSEINVQVENETVHLKFIHKEFQECEESIRNVLSISLDSDKKIQTAVQFGNDIKRMRSVWVEREPVIRVRILCKVIFEDVNTNVTITVDAPIKPKPLLDSENEKTEV